MTTLLEALADMRHYIRCGPELPEQCPACVRYDALQVEVLKAIEELAEARRDVAELLTLSDIAVKVENRAALVAEVRKRYGLDAIDTARKETL